MGRGAKEPGGDGKKNNPPPQAFCLTRVDAKEGLGFFFFFSPYSIFFSPSCLSLVGRFQARWGNFPERVV